MLPAPSLAREDADQPIAFQVLYRQLDSADPSERDRAVTIVGALSPPSAVRPLVRAYVHHGDQRLLNALTPFGPRVTLTVGRQALDDTRSPVERARLLHILGASGDLAAVPILQAAVHDLDVPVRAAAAAALVELGEPSGADALNRLLLSPDPTDRLPAVEAAARLKNAAANEVLEAHLRRYLALGGAVPREVSVAMPLLTDLGTELAQLICARLRQSTEALSLVVGPGARGMAEHQRAVFEGALPEHQLFYTPARHSPPEQFEVLMRARTATLRGRRVALVGDLPSPMGIHPPPHFLFKREGDAPSVRIVLVGQQEFAVAMEWWYYIDDCAEVPTTLDIVLTAHRLGAEDMTDEEMALLALAGGKRREAFARALLAHRTNV